MAGSGKEIRWDRFPRVKALAEGKKWLEIQHTIGLATNTIEAHALWRGRGPWRSAMIEHVGRVVLPDVSC